MIILLFKKMCYTMYKRENSGGWIRKEDIV